MVKVNTDPEKLAEPTPTRDHGRAIGSILVEQGILSPGDRDEIQRFATEHGIRFGDAAQKLRLLNQRDIDLAIAQQYSYPTLPRGGNDGVSGDVIAGYLPQSELVEPLRALRSQLNLRWVSEHKVLAITSPGRGEGRCARSARWHVAKRHLEGVPGPEGVRLPAAPVDATGA